MASSQFFQNPLSHIPSSSQRLQRTLRPSSLSLLLSDRRYLFALPLVKIHYAISPIPFPLPFPQYERVLTMEQQCRTSIQSVSW